MGSRRQLHGVRAQQLFALVLRLQRTGVYHARLPTYLLRQHFACKQMHIKSLRNEMKWSASVSIIHLLVIAVVVRMYQWY